MTALRWVARCLQAKEDVMNTAKDQVKKIIREVLQGKSLRKSVDIAIS